MSAAGKSAQAEASQSFGKDLQTIPNLLSISRILMTVGAGALYLLGFRGTALIIGIVAGVTDILDGWLARKLNQSTELGAILDRLSDLALETVALTICLYYRLVPPVFLILYLLREWLVISARLYASEKGTGIPSSILGKVKTDLVLGSFVGLFAAHAGMAGDYGQIAYRIGYAMMVAGLVASYLSGFLYLRSFVHVYNGRPD